MMRTLGRVMAAGLATGCACLAWGLAETRMFAVRRIEASVLPPGQSPIRVLHISDIHLLARQRYKLRFISSLSELSPDLIVNTGDNVTEPEAVAPLFEAFGDLRDVPGVFVFGSNDYRRPSPINPAAYLVRPTTRHEPQEERTLPWEQLRDQMEAVGWVNLMHRQVTVEVAGRKLAFRGTDDAHLHLDDYSLVAGPASPEADLNIGVTHAPYLRLLDAMTADGMDLIFAGHTHGGQVCVPFKGALVTNCDLDVDRVKGLSTHSYGGKTAFLEVSAGIGGSPFAPYRFACRPEVTLLTLVARQQ